MVVSVTTENLLNTKIGTLKREIDKGIIHSVVKTLGKNR